MTNKRIRKKHAKQNWLRLQQEMADPVAFHRKYAGTDLWIGREAQESEVQA